MSQKVCLITGATSYIGQQILTELVSSGRKVLALGDEDSALTNTTLNNRLIKATSTLPISADAFKEYNVQFCFGDIADISFLASIFNTAAKTGIIIEFVLHLDSITKKHTPTPFGDGTANLLEVCRAYWQSNKETFKGLFYAAGKGDVVRKFSRKDGFPIKFYKLRTSFAENTSKQTPADNLYRMFTPVDIPFMKKYQSAPAVAKTPASGNTYIHELSQAISRLLNSI